MGVVDRGQARVAAEEDTAELRRRRHRRRRLPICGHTLRRQRAPSRWRRYWGHPRRCTIGASCLLPRPSPALSTPSTGYRPSVRRYAAVRFMLCVHRRYRARVAPTIVPARIRAPHPHRHRSHAQGGHRGHPGRHAGGGKYPAIALRLPIAWGRCRGDDTRRSVCDRLVQPPQVCSPKRDLSPGNGCSASSHGLRSSPRPRRCSFEHVSMS